ncbi:DinB family protein [Streptomyces oceani]|uniref:Mini-circle protein n=1 Tax=Streptomyces oceani TaxID=1075402 RepID=A0A1E7JVV0_9ACTN|nr:DinB family protein [Streptomyces oceani]OEU94775.1 hypothetical protein AN216_24240 [Streptomyces oceani]
MPKLLDAEVPGDERGALLICLEGQRQAVRRAVSGLTPEQAVSTPSTSALSLAGLVKHLAEAEETWLSYARGLPRPTPRDRDNWHGSFALEGAETPRGVLDTYAAVARQTERLVRAVPSLDDTFVLPEAPWFPRGPRSWRWMLLNLISEVARHAGHADVIRETLDGRTAGELTAEPGPAPRADGTP